MKPGTEKLQMWLVRETPAAVLVCDHEGKNFWLPRSLIDDLKIDAAAPLRGHPAVEFTLPEWKINQASLWDFVLA